MHQFASNLISLTYVAITILLSLTVLRTRYLKKYISLNIYDFKTDMDVSENLPETLLNRGLIKN